MASICLLCVFIFFFFKQKTAYEMRISDWSSDVCSSDLLLQRCGGCIRFGGQAHIRTLLALNDVDLQLAEIGRIEREGGAPRSGGYICDLPRHAIDPLPIHAHVDDAIGQHRTSVDGWRDPLQRDRKSTRLNSSH